MVQETFLRALRKRATFQAQSSFRAWLLRGPGETEFRALALDVLRFEDGKPAEISVLRGELFPSFGLPLTL